MMKKSQTQVERRCGDVENSDNVKDVSSGWWQQVASRVVRRRSLLVDC